LKSRNKKGQPRGAEKSVSVPAASPSTEPLGRLAKFLEQLTAGKIILLIVFAVLLAYSNSLAGQFVFDDIDQVVNNPAIRHWGNLISAFKGNVWQFREGAQFLRAPVPPPYYRPLFTVLITIQYQLFGMWVQGWHLVGVALHIGCAIEVFYVSMRLFAKRHVAVIAALLFAVYPIHVESVSWVSGITDPLCGLFFLGSFLLYLGYRSSGSTRFLAGSLVAFALSILSKETGLSLVGLIFVYELIERLATKPGSNDRQAQGGIGRLLMVSLRPVAPFLGLVLLYLTSRVLALGRLTWSLPYSHRGPFTDTLLTLPLVALTYILHLIWPVGLSVAYQTHFVTTPTSGEFLFPATATVLVVIVVFIYRRKISREVWLSAALAIIPLLPVLNLGQLYEQYLVFDRFLYLPSIGICCAAALGISRADRWAAERTSGGAKVGARQFWPAGGLILVLAAMTYGTARENLPWKDDYSLWSNAALRRPGFWAAHYNVGLELMDRGRFSEALDEFKLASALAPRTPSVLNSVGRADEALGNLQAAQEAYKQAIEADPEFFESINNLGDVYFKLGQNQTAELYFKKALDIQPLAVESHYNLARCYDLEHRYPEAVGEYEAVLKEAPGDAETYYRLGVLYQRMGRAAEADNSFKVGLGLAKSDELRQLLVEASNQSKVEKKE